MRENKRLICVCVAFVLLCAFAGVASARTIYVPDDYEKIRWAVDNASVGDTIIVRDGIYYESITVSKQLTIKSENGPDNCIVNGGGLWGVKVFMLEADRIRIEGFTITGGIYGIFINSNNNSISNNIISSNTEYGIYLYESNNNSISNSIIRSNIWGIYLNYSNKNSISNNNILNNEYGIDLEYSNKNRISNNNISNNGCAGIELSDSNNNSISNNIIRSNNDGIRLLYSNENSISNNIISSNNLYGIYLEGSNNNSISNNVISSNNYGIYLCISDGNSISYNSISSNTEYGIYLYYYSNNIYLNNFINNTYNAFSYGNNIWNSTEPITYTYKGSTFTNYMGNYWSDYKGSDADEDGIGRYSPRNRWGC